LVGQVVRPAFAGGAVTPESAAAWKELMHQTVALGSEAVPAIREFLGKNEDYDLGSGSRQLLGYDSARAAMFDALMQIGGAEAEEALTGTLAAALDPREIAMLARNLETMSPGQHADAAVEAARQALAAAGRGEMADRDVAPAFEVLNRFGGGAVAADMEQAAAKWNYYSAIALAQLPDGAGVPSLIRLAEGADNLSKLGSDPAIRMLAGLAGQNDEARTAFLDLVKKDRVSESTWTGLAPILAGDSVQFTDPVLGESVPQDAGSDVRRTHLTYGNQNFYSAAPTGNAAAEQLGRQLTWLDQLAAAATSPVSQTAVRNARSLIERRLYGPSPRTAGQ
jgi:hypothetical protein